MSRVKTFAVLSVLASVIAGQASAASPNFCARYAQNAVFQFKAMMAEPACRRPPTNLWHPNGAMHYEWCLTAHPQEVMRQGAIRASALDRCDPAWAAGQ